MTCLSNLSNTELIRLVESNGTATEAELARRLDAAEELIADLERNWLEMRLMDFGVEHDDDDGATQPAVAAGAAAP